MTNKEKIIIHNIKFILNLIFSGSVGVITSSLIVGNDRWEIFLIVALFSQTIYNAINLSIENIKNKNL